MGRYLIQCVCITGGQPGLWVALSEVRASCILRITGGQLGLWVGISAITIFELLDLIVQLVNHLCSVRDQRIKKEEVCSRSTYTDTDTESTKQVRAASLP